MEEFLDAEREMLAEQEAGEEGEVPDKKKRKKKQKEEPVVWRLNDYVDRDEDLSAEQLMLDLTNTHGQVCFPFLYWLCVCGCVHWLFVVCYWHPLIK